MRAGPLIGYLTTVATMIAAINAMVAAAGVTLLLHHLMDFRRRIGSAGWDRICGNFPAALLPLPAFSNDRPCRRCAATEQQRQPNGNSHDRSLLLAHAQRQEGHHPAGGTGPPYKIVAGQHRPRRPVHRRTS